MPRLGQSPSLLAERDRIGAELGRITALLASIEDPGPFHQVDRASGFPLWRNIQTGEQRGIPYTGESIESGALVGWEPVYVSNPDYIADEARRELVAADLQAQAADLRAQLNAVLAQIFGAHPGGVITVTGRTDPATGKVIETITSRPPDIVAPPTGAPIVSPDDVPPAAGGGGGGFIIPDDPNEVSQAGMAPSGGGLGIGMLVAGGAALWFLFGRRRRKDA